MQSHISTKRAQEIAAQYHSPSPHDDQIARLSHGMFIEDWERLQAQVVRTIAEIHPGDTNELHDLLEWVVFKKRSVGRIR